MTPHAAGSAWFVVLLLLAACSDVPRRGRMCNVEQLEVTWPATIERGGATASEQLTTALLPTSVTPEAFDSLTETLVRGRATAPAVLWSVPAFNTSPGGISFVHGGALRRGEVLRVVGVQDGGGWGVMPPLNRGTALAGVEAGEFVARDLSGTIVVLETQPFALRLDVTARDSAGATIRVRGDAQFSFRRERRRCDGAAGRQRG